MDAGTVTALIGPSGSGKSTLLRCLNLLERPDAGASWCWGSELDFSHHLSRQQVLTLRQHRHSVPELSAVPAHDGAGGSVMGGLVTVLKWPREKAKAGPGLLDKVGLRHKAEAVPATLSGGQQQRVAIAGRWRHPQGAALRRARTSALDPELALEVLAVLRQLARENTTMLIATHDLRLAAQIKPSR